MKSESVRSRLAFLNVSMLGVALFMLGLLIFSGAHNSLLDSVDKEMRTRAKDRADRIARQHTAVTPTGTPRLVGVSPGSNPQIVTPNRDTIHLKSVGDGEYDLIFTPRPDDPSQPRFRTRNLDLENGRTYSDEKPYDYNAYVLARRGETTFSDLRFENEPIRLLTMPVVVNGEIKRVLQYPQPMAGTYAALDGLKWTLVTGFPIIIVIATIGGYILTSRSLKPVREITDTAATISAESLDGRLEVKGRDEFAGLAQTFNGMLDRLQGAFTRMEQAVEQQRRFAADASHELRTPLTVIKAHTSLAMKGVRTPDEYKKTLAAVNTAADTMGKLVNDLLLLARSDSDHLELLHEPLCLKKVLREAITSVERPGIAKIELNMEDEGTEVTGDGHALLRVFMNFLENASRYTPEDGAIRIIQTREDDEIVIAVQDTGAGISPEDLPRVCDRFYRADESRARIEGGSGLGLAICASLVEAHGGTMAIASELGEGTTVTVRLPAHDEEA